MPPINAVLSKPERIGLNPMASSASSALPPQAASQPKRPRISTSGVGPSWNMYERLCTCDKKARTWLGSFVHSQYTYKYIRIYIIHVSLLSRSCLADGFKPLKRHYYLAMGIIISFLWSNINKWLKRPTVFLVISSQTQIWLIIIPKCKGVFRVAANTPNTIGFDFTLTLKNTVVTNQSNIAMGWSNSLLRIHHDLVGGFNSEKYESQW